MRNVVFRMLLVFIVSTFSGCENKEDLAVVNAIDSDGLSLYWDHEVFGEEGRRYRFELSTKKALPDEYELFFQRSMSGNSITARLISKVSKGKCAVFPGTGPGCVSRGKFYISEKDLRPGTYTLNFVTSTFVESTRFVVTSEKAVLELSPNGKISSSITEVFPIPRQLLFGSIVYSGSANTQAAKDLIAYLSVLGVTPTTLPNYPYRHLNVSQSAHLAVKDWPEDNHMISLLYSMKGNFRDIISELTTYYTKTDRKLTVNLYTSFGDEARFNNSETSVLYGSEK